MGYPIYKGLLVISKLFGWKDFQESLDFCFTKFAPFIGINRYKRYDNITPRRLVIFDRGTTLDRRDANSSFMQIPLALNQC